MEGSVPRCRPDLGPCLQFTGSIKTRWGYGQFYYEGRNRSAHTAAWEIQNGPVTGDLTVDHLCRNTSCVRVSHMELVTRAENYRRAVAARTHCPNGHEYATVGHYVYRGRRRCRACCALNEHAKTRTAQGLPDRRRKHDPTAVSSALNAVMNGAPVTKTALQHGIGVKYLDKLRRKARARLEGDT